MTDTTEKENATSTGRDDTGTSDDQTGVPGDLREPLVGSPSDDTASLPLETVFDILRNERRQRVLGYLALVDDDVVRIGDLAEHIAAAENEMPVEALSSQQRKRVYVALYQCHLPKMADADVVDFDKDRGTIKPGTNADQLRPYLDVGGQPADEPGSVDETPFVLFSAAAVVAYLLAAFLGGDGGVVGGGAVLVAAAVVAVALASRDKAS